MLKYLFIPAVMTALLVGCGKNEPAGSSANAAPAAPAQSASAATSTAASPPSSGTDVAAKGEHIFKATCVMCHGTGAGGAPLFGNKGDWTPRIAKGKDMLYDHALHGFTGEKGTMPAKGANASLADDDVKAAVDYMLGKVQ